MLHAHTSESTYAAEAPALAAGVDLMAWAVAGIVEVVRVHAPHQDPVAVFAGRGNNGADALYAAARLARDGREVRVVTVFDEAQAGGATSEALVAAHDAGVGVVGTDHLAEVAAAPVWIDGLTGIGFRPPARDGLAETLTSLHTLQQKHDPLVFAVDLPSGLSADGGTVAPSIRAHHTITFGAHKAVHFLPPASYECGQIHLVDIGIGTEFARRRGVVSRVSATDLAVWWPRPGPWDHKYTRGVVGMVTGSAEYPGAAVLCAGGALAAGPGMVRYRGEASADVVRAHPVVVTAPGRAQAWVVGSGISGKASSSATMVERAITEAMDGGVPLVVDAGALEWVEGAGIGGYALTPMVVLTPHAGELTSLLVRAGKEVTRETIEADPAMWARRATELTGATIVLKGGTTLIASGSELFSQADGTPWMASAGSGDVLAGVLGTVLAGWQIQTERGTGPAWPTLATAVAAAVGLHGMAGTRASGGGPITSLDIARAIPGVLREVLAH